MTAAEFIVVYLSSGAPFGVLVFFSRRSPYLIRRIAESVLAALFWPLVAISWLHRRLLLRQRARKQNRPFANFAHGPLREPLFIEYETLTRALVESRNSTVEPSGELFKVAGHSNPSLAAKCAQRRRDMLLSRRQQASSVALIEWLRTLATEPERAFVIADRCQQLGDDQTARVIEQTWRGIDAQDTTETKTVPKRVQLAA